MMEKILFGVCVLASGVFGADTKGEEKVSMMVGKPYTFLAGVVFGNTSNQIIWRFNGLRLAQLRGNGTPDYYPIFRDRPHVNQKTGDLSIIVTSEHSGTYSFQIIINGKDTVKNFSFTADTHLPDPNISVKCSPDSSNPQCVLFCSVENGSQGQTLSWYKNHSLVSNISVPDINTCNLSLEINCQDENIGCVVSNSFSNKTTLFNSTDHCQHSESESSKPEYNVGGIVAAVVVVAVLVACPSGCFCYKKYYKKPGHNPKEEFELKEAVKSEETTALHNEGEGNGTLRTEDLPSTNTITFL